MSPVASPQMASIHVTHTYSFTSFHQHGRRLKIKLVLYGATACIHVYIKINVRLHTLCHLIAGWTVLQITGHVDSWGGIQGLGRWGWRKNSEHEEFCVVASQALKLCIDIRAYFPPPLVVFCSHSIYY